MLIDLSSLCSSSLLHRDNNPALGEKKHGWPHYIFKGGRSLQATAKHISAALLQVVLDARVPRAAGLSCRGRPLTAQL